MGLLKEGSNIIIEKNHFNEVLYEMMATVIEHAKQYPENKTSQSTLIFMEIYSVIINTIYEQQNKLNIIPNIVSHKNNLEEVIRTVQDNEPPYYDELDCREMMKVMRNELLAGDEGCWENVSAKVMRCAIDHLTMYWGSFSKNDQERLMYVKDDQILPYIHQDSFPEPTLDIRALGMITISMLNKYISENKEKSPEMIDLFMIISLSSIFDENTARQNEIFNIEDFVAELREDDHVAKAAWAVWAARCKTIAVPPMPARYVDKIRNSSIALMRQIYRDLVKRVFKGDV